MLALLQALLVLLAVDFVSGLVHWAEDTFWTEETPLVGRWIVRPNVLHHRDATAFVPLSYGRSNGDLLAAGAALVLTSAFLGCLTWQVWLFALVGGHANQLHKWAHAPRRELPLLVRGLMRVHLLQSAAHHNGHHGGRQDTHYCVVTELLNPVLDRLGFWRGLERLVARPSNAPRRTDLWGERRAA